MLQLQLQLADRDGLGGRQSAIMAKLDADYPEDL
jgi:hypothetical protein